MNIKEEIYHDKVHRCSICNSVNVEDIQTNIGDFKDKISFVPDPKNKSQIICTECAEVIQEQRDDYAFRDSWMDDLDGDFLRFP